MQAETPLDLADEDVLDLIKEYYERNPPRAKPIVPGVEKFLNPSLPDAITIIPITKGSRKLRDKENRPEKLPKTITETPKKEDAKIEVHYILCHLRINDRSIIKKKHYFCSNYLLT